ncbi:MAG: hypothetical protein AAF628_21735 [Planctomycetota bacterium]
MRLSFPTTVARCAARPASFSASTATPTPAGVSRSREVGRCALALAATLALTLAGCTGSSAADLGPVGGDFLVLRTEPQNNGRLFLNDPISLDFSTPVDLSTANLNTIAFQVFDASGNPVPEQPAGHFRLGRSPGDAEVGRRLEFVPRFPTNNAYTDGGFRPGRRYSVQLVGGSDRGDVLKDSRGKALSAPATFAFATADGTTPGELFRDTRPGGPRRLQPSGFSVTPVDAQGLVPLNKAGQSMVQVVLRFDQPLNPHSANVPVDVSPDPLARPGQRGRIFLEYADPDPELGSNAWIPAVVELTRNDLTGSEVRLFPIGVLPNNADIRVMVAASLEDMAGESNTGETSFDDEFATFRTQQAFDPQFDGIVAAFDATSDQIDLGAPFLEPVADIGAGFVKAAFNFAGTAPTLDYEPTSADVILNTAFTQIQPKGAPPFVVSGGVFRFNSVRIPRGVTVRGTGPNPMIWQATRNFVVEGTIHVDGGLGERVNSLGSANSPSGGGIGTCGGGNGGRGSPNTAGPSLRGEDGYGPGQAPSGGGRGGAIGVGRCNRGSGGGGGSYATQGDPYYPLQSSGTSFVQQNGEGGYGCSGGSGAPERSLQGGAAGPLAFIDARLDNNFWGSGVDLSRQIRITGEVDQPRAGAGGGGGGDLSKTGPWIGHAKGGGGGGGAGVLIIQALDTIEIRASGIVSAVGGDGGGGEQSASNTEGAGGGGGSGGMVVLMAGNRIIIDQHGGRYAAAAGERDYSFAVSADGGIGSQGDFGGPRIAGKYPPLGVATQMDQNPAGGFGGMGLVQLMAPPGDNQSDQTNTVLDDRIIIRRGGVEVTGQEKIDTIAWRGFINASGRWVDDDGNDTYAADPTTEGDEGDIRPAPVLLPSPISHFSRVRSKWLDTGSSVRRPFAVSGGGGPRTINESGAFRAGPTYEFAGTNPGGTAARDAWAGYLDYTPSGLGIALVGDVVVPPTGIATFASDATFQGTPSYRVSLAQAVLGADGDRYAQYQAQLVDAASQLVGEYRILAHDDRTLELSPDQGPLPVDLAGLRLQVLAKFVRVRTSDAPGLGRTYSVSVPTGGVRTMPVANVRLGFAFHKDPTNPDLDPATRPGIDLNRKPARLGTFLYDLADPAVQEDVRTFLGGSAAGTGPGAPFVMWDVLFNTRFSEDEVNNTAAGNALSPSSPRPEVTTLVLPYRF